MSKSYCFYHDDLDGECSAAIVSYMYTKQDKDVKLIRVQHGELEFFKHETAGATIVSFTTKHTERTDFSSTDTVVFVDFTPPTDMLDLVVDNVAEVIWIDHHKDAIDSNEKHLGLPGLRATTQAGCELTWRFFSGLYNGGEELPMPPAVWLIGRYDVWDHKDDRVVPFTYGMGLMQTDPAQTEVMCMWKDLFELLVPEHPVLEDGTVDTTQVKWDALLQLLSLGSVVVAYKAKCEKQLLKYAMPATIVTFTGESEVDKEYSAIVINSVCADKYVFDHLGEDKDKYDIGMWYSRRDGEYVCSIRALKDGVNVSTIAQAFGGNGHPEAAGFSVVDSRAELFITPSAHVIFN